jgi:GntR family transcriptional regulator
MTTASRRPAAEPKYYAVTRHLLDFIGSSGAGAPVPTERELAGRMKTSRTTVRQALGELVVEGRVVRRQGSGTYVAEPKITWPLYLASFTEQVQASGFTPSAQVLGTQRVGAGAELAQRLHLPSRTAVHKLDRLRPRVRRARSGSMSARRCSWSAARTSIPPRVPVELGRTWFRGDRVTLVTRLGPRRT